MGWYLKLEDVSQVFLSSWVDLLFKFLNTHILMRKVFYLQAGYFERSHSQVLKGWRSISGPCSGSFTFKFHFIY